MTPLPDELIKEILEPALRVLEEDFSNTSPTSPFSVFTPSTSAYLVVCKSWLRVATPLLYNVVVLRSTAQTKALERTLVGNKLLGTFIKKIRVEGGFGLSMHRIITCAPNTVELWLSLSLISGDSVAGLCRGLPKMNPTRVILWDSEESRFGDNAPTRKLVETISECIVAWKSLEILEYPFEDVYPMHKAMPIAIAILTSRNLKTLVLNHTQADENFLRTLVQNSHLQNIRVVCKQTGDLDMYLTDLRTTVHLQAVVRLDDTLKKSVSFEFPDSETDGAMSPDLTKFRPRNSSFTPLVSSALHIQEKIWRRILYFAMFIDEQKIELEMTGDGFESLRIDDSEQQNNMNILLVSKLFYKLGRSHCYKCLILNTSRQLEHIAELFEKEPSLGAHIRSLYTYFKLETPQRPHIRAVLERATGLLRLVSPTFDISPPLRNFARQTTMLTFRGLTTLAKTAGSTLLELSGQLIDRPATPKSPSPLFAFTALRHLEWNTPTVLDFTLADVPREALANLETLSFSSDNDTFLVLLGYMELPALRHVSFTRTIRMEGTDEFLVKHGSKIVSLETHSPDGVFEKCPALSVVCISGSLNVPSFMPHPNLTKLIFTKLLANPGQIKTEYEALDEIDFGIYPSLQEVKVHLIKWPATEREINKGHKSLWVKWAERLMKWQVKLTDHKGQHWIPRLK